MDEKGFSLVELVVAMGIAGFVMAGMVAAHRQQTRSGTNLGLKVAAQQNLRASLYHLERDLRMAGAHLTEGAYNQTVPILTAEAGKIAFSWDDDRDGVIGADEVITYRLYDSAGLKTRNLGRSEGGARNQPVAQNIDALDIHYFAENATVPMTRPVTGRQRQDIRRVQITLVARTLTPLKLSRVRKGTPYLNQQGEEVLTWQNDHFQRLLLTSEVALRNMRTPGDHGN